MSNTIPGKGSKNPHYIHKQTLLGGYAITSDSNTEVSSTSTWEVSVDANTTIIRLRTDELTYMKYNGDATSIDYDYFIPQNATVDLYNIVEANTISVIAHSANAHVLISQY